MENKPAAAAGTFIFQNIGHAVSLLSKQAYHKRLQKSIKSEAFPVSFCQNRELVAVKPCAEAEALCDF